MAQKLHDVVKKVIRRDKGIRFGMLYDTISTV